MMTTFDAIVSMAQTLLRGRGQWHAGATAFCDIDLAVNQCADLLPGSTRSLCEAAISELKRRATPTIQD